MKFFSKEFAQFFFYDFRFKVFNKKIKKKKVERMIMKIKPYEIGVANNICA